MKRVADTFLSPISVDRSAKAPMHRQLYNWIRSAILDGRMRPGQRLPSTRGLASDLKISRIPVLQAYEQLFAEGYLETFAGTGTCVARLIPDESLRATARPGRVSRDTSEKAHLRHISHRGAALARTPVESGLASFGLVSPLWITFRPMSGRSWWHARPEKHRIAPWRMAMPWDIWRFAKPLQNI